MFGHHNDHPVAASAKTPSQSEVAHQFDQTNGVMKAFDDYQARMASQPRAATAGSSPGQSTSKTGVALGLGNFNSGRA